MSKVINGKLEGTVDIKYCLGNFYKIRDYLDKNNILILFCILICAIVVLWKIIPPGQTPDELAHMYRASSLAHGNIVLKAKDGLVGDDINKGLVDYYNKFSTIPFHKEEKAWNVQGTSEIRFGDDFVYTAFPTHAVYFPLSYIPQALAIGIGEYAKMRVEKVIALARIFNAIAVFFIFYAVVKIWCIPKLVQLLLLMPLSLFQLSTVSTDGLHFALVALTTALFLNLNEKFSWKSFTWLVMLVFILATHRMNLFVLCLMPFWLAWKYRNSRKGLLFLSFLLIFSIVAWLLLVMKLVPTPREGQGMLHIFGYYIKHPFNTIGIIFNTLTNAELLSFYKSSFVGILGWLDYSVKNGFINVTYFVLLCVGILSGFGNKGFLLNFDASRLFLIFLCVLGFLSTFVLLLVQWTPFPCSTYIEGVQGRYFINLMIIMGFALVNRRDNDTSKNSLCTFVIVLYGIFSLYFTNAATLERYWG